MNKSRLKEIKHDKYLLQYDVAAWKKLTRKCCVAFLNRSRECYNDMKQNFNDDLFYEHSFVAFVWMWYENTLKKLYAYIYQSSVSP